MKTLRNSNSRLAFPAIAVLALTLSGCVPEEKAAMDFDLVLCIPAAQLDPAKPVPLCLTALIEPLPTAGSTDKEPLAWSPWPSIQVIAEDGKVLTTWKASDPVTDGDRALGRTPSADERTALFLQQFAGKTAGELFPGVVLGRVSAPESIDTVDKQTIQAAGNSMAMMVEALKSGTFVAFHPAVGAFTEAQKSEILAGGELALSAAEARQRLSAALPEKLDIGAADRKSVSVLCWLTDPRPPAPAPVLGEKSKPEPPPSPPASEPEPQINTAPVLAEPTAAATAETPVVGPPDGPPITVTNNNFYILPNEPPTNLPEATRKEWPRLIKDAKPVDGAEFKFQFSSNDLDRENLAAVKQYARDIALKYPGRSIIVGGYSDDIGELESCRAMAERRAESVASILRERGISPMVAGFGQAPPDRAGPVTNPADREKRRVAIIYVLDEKPKDKVPAAP